MDNAIIEFFEERRSEKIKKDVKSSLSEEEKDTALQLIDEKFKLKNWIPDAAGRAGQLSMTSHPSKFSHPNAARNWNGKTTAVLAMAPHSNDGFLRSGNVEVELDALGNAASLDVYKFLTLVLEDGRSLIEHIESDSNEAKDLLGDLDTPYEELKSGFLSMKLQGNNLSSSSRLKQVYFPIGSNQYHLLSILSPSGMLYSLTERIKDFRFSEFSKEQRKNRKDNKYSQTGYDEILNTTVLGYGGTKPQNVSVLNNSYAGKSYLLDSRPPSLRVKNVRLPTRDFFANCLWPKNYETSFHSLHALLTADINNIRIREGRDAIFQYLFDRIIEKVWQIRNEPAGWSEKDNYLRLPSLHKKVLDSKWDGERESLETEVDDFVKQAVRWMIYAYRKVVGNKALILGDDVIVYLVKLLQSHKEILL